MDIKKLKIMILNGEDVSNVDTSEITSMHSLFQGCEDFNQDISSWDVSNVKDMSRMFYGCRSFNKDISSWDVKGVENMTYMFKGCESFNQDISSWDVSSMNSTVCMFKGCRMFNQDLNKWDTISLENMFDMFQGCKSFNYKNFKGKFEEMWYAIDENEFELLNKEELLDFIKMYKFFDNFKLKVYEKIEAKDIKEIARDNLIMVEFDESLL